MLTDVSLCRLRELLQLASGSCELATEAATEVLNRLPFQATNSKAVRGWSDWWEGNSDPVGKGFGYAQKAGHQLANAAALCEIDLPYDCAQLRKISGDLCQIVDEVVTAIASFHHAADKADFEAFNRIWCKLWGLVVAAGADTLTLMNSEAFKQRETPLTPDEARAKFCFEQWQSGKVYKEINAHLKQHPDWEHFESATGVRGPINAWAKRLGVQPRKGNRGRPK